MLTSKTTGLLVISISSIFLGFFVRNPYAVLVAIPLTTYVVLSLLIRSDRVHTNVTIGRSLSKDSMYEGETVHVTLEVHNRGRKLEFLQVTDQLPKELVVSRGSSTRVLDLNPGESFSFSYEITPKLYGFHELGPTTIGVNDSQFMLSQKKVFPDSAVTLKVLPKIQYIPKISISPKRTKNWPGEIVARRPGPGMEFYSLREYAEGDPIRRINWKSSSKSAGNRLFTNQFMVELGGDSIIAVDVRTISSVGEPPDSTDAYSVR
ncbi:MAG: DUF58 domain-containing protein, partial [Nitrososphaerales archaeon]